MMQIFVATTNAGKLAEFAQCARGEEVEVLPLPGLDGMPEPVEDAETFGGNARRKAVAYSLLAAGAAVLADDSGLEAGALEGRPGVHSARFADEMSWGGEGSKDERNNACLLAMLDGVAKANGAAVDREARFVCALALAVDGEVVLEAEGALRGELLRTPRGASGFGYDPLFLLPGCGVTLAELGAAEKWEISHRGRAFRKLLAKLREGGSSRNRTR